MKELIDKLSKETGLTPEQAQQAIHSVSSYIKMKSPALFHEQVDVLLNGGSMMDGMKKKMADIKDEIEDAAKNLGDKAEEMAKNVGTKISEVFKK